MESIEVRQQNELREYYKKIGLTIVGLNDSQGTNVNTTFMKKGLLDYVVDYLSTDNIDPIIINAFSLMINKTEHIDYLLSNNLSLEEIKQSQIYSAIGAFEKVASDFNLPKFLGQIGNLYKMVYKFNEGDKDIQITSSLRDSKEPIVIYSSGINNLMREIHNNPLAITGDYKNRDKTPNFNYTLQKSNDPKTMNIVIDGIKRNFENIYSINKHADIFALGAYLPQSVKVEELNVFRDLICKYNDLLGNLCREYNASFISTWATGEKYLEGKNNFNISSDGHNDLASKILSSLYNKKICNENSGYKRININKEFMISNNGVKGIIEDLEEDYKKSLSLSNTLDGYERQVQLKIADEHLREGNVFRKILKKVI